MPKGSVPERFRDLLESRVLGHLATLGVDNRPQVNPVWFISDGSEILLSIKPDTVKYRNLRQNPAVAMSILDPANDFRYVEMRGAVVAFELYENLDWVNQLAQKYTDADFTGGVDGEQRYKVTVRVDSWTGQG